MKFLFSFLMAFAICANAFAGMDRILDSTCRVDGSCTGIVYTQDPYYFYILTAGHCSKKDKKDVPVEFFFTGSKSEKFKSDCIWHVNDAKPGISSKDLAILRLRKDRIYGRYPYPKIMKLASPYTPVSTGQVVTTFGCPDGYWPSGIKGHVVSRTYETFSFSPNIIGGQSGSAVCDSEGKEIVGIIIWRSKTPPPVIEITVSPLLNTLKLIRPIPPVPYEELDATALSVRRIYDLVGWQY